MSNKITISTKQNEKHFQGYQWTKIIFNTMLVCVISDTHIHIWKINLKCYINI